MFRQTRFKKTTSSQTVGRRRPPENVRWLIRWHRRVGLSAAFVVILLSTTGIALNHIDDFFDANEFVSVPWLLDWYGITVPQNRIADQTAEPNVAWIDGTLVIDQTPVLFNQSTMIGVLRHDELLTIFTADRLHIFTETAKRVESVAYQTPDRFDRAVQTGSGKLIALANRQKVTLFDLTTLAIANNADQHDAANSVALPDTQNLTNRIKTIGSTDPLYQQARNYSLLKTKVLLDLHSGRFLGAWGKWLVDLFALCFVLLAASGIIVWWRRKKV